MLALVLLVPTVGLPAGNMVGRALTKRAEGDKQKHHIGGKPSFVTGRAGWPIVSTEMIAKGRMFIFLRWSRRLGEDRVALMQGQCPPHTPSAFIFPTAPVPKHQAVGFDLPPNGGLNTTWTGGFEALHCLTSPPSLASGVFFSPIKVLQPCQGKYTVGTSSP